MCVYDTDQFPYVEFGNDLKRQIRMIFSPDIGNAQGVNIVTATIPPGGISEGHTHPDSDEIIHFSIAGKAVIDGQELDVPANGFIFAGKNSVHECVNKSSSENLELICIFTPAFKPYGKYPELIERTRAYLAEREVDGHGI